MIRATLEPSCTVACHECWNLGSSAFKLCMIWSCMLPGCGLCMPFAWPWPGMPFCIMLTCAMPPCVCVCEAHAGCKRYLAILKYVMLMGLPASHVHGCGPRGVSGRLLAMNEVSSLVEVSKSGAARRGVGVDCRSQVAGPERWELGRTCWLGRTRADGSRPAAA
jgi:hypothetical protein